MNHSPILVLGSTGKTGRRIVQRLSGKGHAVRQASRQSDPAFAWNDQSTWDSILEGVAAAYICYAPDLALPGAADSIRAFVERAARQGVRRLVLLSGRGAHAAWELYLGRWTMWNHVRTIAAMTAALLFSLGLMQKGTHL